MARLNATCNALALDERGPEEDESIRWTRDMVRGFPPAVSGTVGVYVLEFD